MVRDFAPQLVTSSLVNTTIYPFKSVGKGLSIRRFYFCWYWFVIVSWNLDELSTCHRRVYFPFLSVGPIIPPHSIFCFITLVRISEFVRSHPCKARKSQVWNLVMECFISSGRVLNSASTSFALKVFVLAFRLIAKICQRFKMVFSPACPFFNLNQPCPEFFDLTGLFPS